MLQHLINYLKWQVLRGTRIAAFQLFLLWPCLSTACDKETHPRHQPLCSKLTIEPTNVIDSAMIITTDSTIGSTLLSYGPSSLFLQAENLDFIAMLPKCAAFCSGVWHVAGCRLCVQGEGSIAVADS
jgi:hypothetical protein